MRIKAIRIKTTNVVYDGVLKDLKRGDKHCCQEEGWADYIRVQKPFPLIVCFTHKYLS
jgi:hypothetical protein